MKWIQILFSAISSAGMISELIRNKNLKNKTNSMYKNMLEYEANILEKFDEKIKKEFNTLYREINALKFIVRFLFIAFIVLIIVLVIMLVFIIFLYRMKSYNL